ncbi:MAG: type II toxin-antitoxin system HicB family antitoxin [Planctomycetes bacterium]|nr:type II toxin-antitoxin system HicB family antitoxin [Planctomycetota bacterium]
MVNAPLHFELQPDGGYVVTCPVIPELITEGDTREEAERNASDALDAVIELYSDMGWDFPVITKARL